MMSMSKRLVNTFKRQSIVSLEHTRGLEHNYNNLTAIQRNSQLYISKRPFMTVSRNVKSSNKGDIFLQSVAKMSTSNNFSNFFKKKYEQLKTKILTLLKAIPEFMSKCITHTVGYTATARNIFKEKYEQLKAKILTLLKAIPKFMSKRITHTVGYAAAARNIFKEKYKQLKAKILTLLKAIPKFMSKCITHTVGYAAAARNISKEKIVGFVGFAATAGLFTYIFENHNRKLIDISLDVENQSHKNLKMLERMSVLRTQPFLYLTTDLTPKDRELYDENKLKITKHLNKLKALKKELEKTIFFIKILSFQLIKESKIILEKEICQLQIAYKFNEVIWFQKNREYAVAYQENTDVIRRLELYNSNQGSNENKYNHVLILDSKPYAINRKKTTVYLVKNKETGNIVAYYHNGFKWHETTTEISKIEGIFDKKTESKDSSEIKRIISICGCIDYDSDTFHFPLTLVAVYNAQAKLCACLARQSNNSSEKEKYQNQCLSFYNMAIKIISKEENKNADLASLLSCKAALLGDLGNLKESLDIHKMAYALRPNDENILCGLGGAINRMESGKNKEDRDVVRLDEAYRYFSRAIQLNDKNANAYVSRGKVLVALNDFDSALLDFEYALSLNKNHTNANLEKSYLMLRKKKCTEAEQYFKRSLFYLVDWPEDLNRAKERLSSLEKGLGFSCNILKYTTFSSLKTNPVTVSSVCPTSKWCHF